MSTAHWFTLAAASQWSGNPIDWTADMIKCALITSSYNPSQDTDQFFSIPEVDETSGTGYIAGGMTMTGVSVGGIVGSHEIPLLASTTQWTGASFSCRYAVIYKSTGNSSTSPLLGWVDFGGTQTVSSGTFAIAWDPTFGALGLVAA